MFDTSIVRTGTVARSRRYTLLTASFAIHSAVAVAAIAMSIATVEFPRNAPDQMEILRPVSTFTMPPALGPSGPPRVPQKAPARPVATPAPTTEITAPTEIPQETPVVVETAISNGSPEAPSGSGTENVGGGGGHPGGQPFGVGEGPAGGGLPLMPGGDVTKARVLTRVDPVYPQVMIAARRGATVTVRCIIDRNGRIREPEVIRSSFPPFNQAVIDALHRWTFAPGTRRGEPVDTWFELTVTFAVR